ncbi:hypothetical protein ACWEXP_09350 [Staphylococcus pseudoxylosus]
MSQSIVITIIFNEQDEVVSVKFNTKPHTISKSKFKMHIIVITVS